MSAHLFEVVETAIIENRVQCRYPVRGRGWLAGVEVALRNISRSGAQLACPQRLFGQITPCLDEDAVELRLELDGRAELRAVAVYARPFDAEVLIGLKFEAGESEGLAAVDAWVRRLEG